VDTWSWLAIFSIMENNHVMMNNWRPRGILYVGGVMTIVIPSVLIKDQIVEGPLVMLNTCLSLSWLDKSFQSRSRVAQLRPGTRSVKVHTLRGARCESKGRPGLNILAASQSLSVRCWSYSRMDLSCTKGDLRRLMIRSA
jgi:hypothetical protein